MYTQATEPESVLEFELTINPRISPQCLLTLPCTSDMPDHDFGGGLVMGKMIPRGSSCHAEAILSLFCGSNAQALHSSSFSFPGSHFSCVARKGAPKNMGSLRGTVNFQGLGSARRSVFWDASSPTVVLIYWFYVTVPVKGSQSRSQTAVSSKILVGGWEN